MRTYFSARRAELLREQRDRTLFRENFFILGCLWDSCEGAVDRSDSEIVEGISLSGNEARVTTRWDHAFQRLRYILQQSNTSWLIHRVEVQCFECQGQTNRPLCEHCGGTGWFGPGEPHAPNARSSDSPQDKRL